MADRNKTYKMKTSKITHGFQDSKEDGNTKTY